jgi:DNA-binding transcriptional regulator YhcF (GntR family)
MSIQGLQWCIKQECDTPTSKLVLFILSNYADENSSCFPSEKHIAKIVGISDRQVRRCLANLVDKGLISIEERKGTSNRYFLCMDADVQTVRKPTSTNTKPDTKDIYSNDFEMFWKSYPRKIGKYAAAKSFQKECKNVQSKILIEKAKLFSVNCKNTEECFIPHASTWLNQRRYEDTVKKTFKNLDSLAG